MNVPAFYTKKENRKHSHEPDALTPESLVGWFPEEASDDPTVTSRWVRSSGNMRVIVDVHKDGTVSGRWRGTSKTATGEIKFEDLGGLHRTLKLFGAMVKVFRSWSPPRQVT